MNAVAAAALPQSTIADLSTGCIVLLVVAGIAAALAFLSVMIRRSLRQDREMRRSRRELAAVNGQVLWSNIKYAAEGPIAEFIIIFGTVAFVALLFWMALNPPFWK